MKIVYSAKYEIEIEDHPWCPSKYRLVIEKIKNRGFLRGIEVIESPLADDEDALRVHSFEYWTKLNDVDFTEEEIRIADITLTSEVINLFWRMVGGTVLAGELALSDGLCVHLGGGFHHAHQSHASGFCILNDIAIGLRSLLDQKAIRSAAVLDCDLHQGDATAKIFRDDPRVFTVSIHQQDAFPYYKQASDLDFGLPAGTGDQKYLATLDEALDKMFADGRRFDILHYQAGVDPYVKDPIGQMQISEAGLRERDRRAIAAATSRGTPVVVTLGGGYTEDINEVARLHANTVEEAISLWRQQPAMV